MTITTDPKCPILTNPMKFTYRYLYPSPGPYNPFIENVEQIIHLGRDLLNPTGDQMTPILELTISIAYKGVQRGQG